MTVAEKKQTFWKPVHDKFTEILSLYDHFQVFVKERFILTKFVCKNSHRHLWILS